MNFDEDFTEVCFQGSNQQYSSIGSDSCLALGKRQTIIWTNADLIHWRIYMRHYRVRWVNWREDEVVLDEIFLIPYAFIEQFVTL